MTPRPTVPLVPPARGNEPATTPVLPVVPLTQGDESATQPPVKTPVSHTLPPRTDTAQSRASEPTGPVPIVLAFGANLGDRSATIRAAAHELAMTSGITGLRLSPLHESLALTAEGPDETKPGYINAVATARTTLSPEELLHLVNSIEARHGRERAERWGDRTLDIDIISIGDLRSEDPQLTLPHPRAAERDFVLAPWLELNPHAQLPGAGGVAELLSRLETREIR